MSKLFIVVPFKEIPAIVPADWTLASVGGYIEHLRPISEEKLEEILHELFQAGYSRLKKGEHITNAIKALQNGK